jgi:hypothetical protein
MKPGKTVPARARKAADRVYPEVSDLGAFTQHWRSMRQGYQLGWEDGFKAAKRSLGKDGDAK